MIAPDIIRLSPNHNAYPVSGHTVIIHATRSGHSMNPTEFEGTLNYMMLTNPPAGPVSSHWVIARDGRKARVVPDNLQAWHAGTDNPRAWGIELEQGAENDGFTPEQIAALVSVCEGYRDDFGVPAVHAAAPWGMGFIGHQETLQGRSFGKTDPGHLFPWDDFIAALRPQVATIDGLGVVLDDGTDLGNVLPPLPPGRVVAGVGAHFTDDTISRLWPAADAVKVHQIDAFDDGSVRVT